MYDKFDKYESIKYRLDCIVVPGSNQLIDQEISNHSYIMRPMFLHFLRVKVDLQIEFLSLCNYCVPMEIFVTFWIIVVQISYSGEWPNDPGGHTKQKPCADRAISRIAKISC